MAYAIRDAGASRMLHQGIAATVVLSRQHEMQLTIIDPAKRVD